MSHHDENEPVLMHEPTESDDHHDTPKPREKESTPPKIGAYFFTILIFMSLILSLAGMSIGMMDHRRNSSCISIWGDKPKCLGTHYKNMKLGSDFRGTGAGCEKADSLVQAAQAFSIMCLIGGFLTTCVGILQIRDFAELAVVAVIMSCITTVATLVTWSTMLAMYWGNLCGHGVYADDYRIGKGLILFITAWCLQMVANVALIVDILLGNSR